MVAGIAGAEHRYVASMDIGGAYLNADLTKEIYMRLDSEIVDLLVELHPEYGNEREPDGSVIVRLKKALYGFAESSKLWYSLFQKQPHCATRCMESYQNLWPRPCKHKREN